MDNQQAKVTTLRYSPNPPYVVESHETVTINIAETLVEVSQLRKIVLHLNSILTEIGEVVGVKDDPLYGAHSGDLLVGTVKLLKRRSQD